MKEMIGINKDRSNKNIEKTSFFFNNSTVITSEKERRIDNGSW